MFRLLIMLCMFLTGCEKKQPMAEPVQPRTITWPTNTGFPEPSEFTSWQAMTPELRQIGRRTATLCIGFSPEDAAANDKEFGMHWLPLINVRVNETGLNTFRTGKLMPVGSIVVKEKHYNGLSAYALMIKREAGYDKENGDWQYVYVDPLVKASVVEGKLTHCIECHRGAKDTDYLFKFYLNDQLK